MHALLPVLLALVPQEPDLATMVHSSRVTPVQAVEAGLREAKAGVVTKAELEFENGRIVWSLDIAQGQKLVELHLDAKDGRLVERAEEVEDASAIVKPSRVTLVEAVHAALAKHKGFAVMAETRLVEGKPVVTVETFGNGKKRSSTVDASEAHSRESAKGKPEEGEPHSAGMGEEEQEAEEHGEHAEKSGGPSGATSEAKKDREEPEARP